MERATAHNPAATGAKFFAISVATIAAVLFLYAPTLTSLVGTWLTVDSYGHGPLILPISGYLIWRNRERLSGLELTPMWSGLAIVAGLTGLWLLGGLVGIQALQHLSLVMLLPAIILTIYGGLVGRALAFPLIYVIFAVPLGDALVPYLVELTADFTVAALQTFNFPVYREGAFFSIPSGNFLVARACSGIRYLIASLALGTLFSYLMYRSFWRRALFIGLSAVVPIVANCLRALGIVLLAHFSDSRLAVGVDHLIYGWLFFGLVMFLLFWLGARFQESSTQKAAVSNHEGLSKPQLGHNTVALIAAAVAAVIVVAAGPVLLAKVDESEARLRVNDAVVLLPHIRSEWVGPANPAGAWVPQFQGAQTVNQGRYQSTNGDIELYVARYRSQRQGSEMFNIVNAVYNSPQWVPGAVDQIEILSNDGKRFAVIETAVRTRGTRRLVWHWYRIGGAEAISGLVIKLRAIWLLVTGEHGGGSVVVMSAEYQYEPQEARDLMGGFFASHSGLVAVCADGLPTPTVQCEVP